MKKWLVFKLVIVLLTSSLFADIDRSKPPEPGPAPEIQLAEYDRFELPNGLKIFVVENHKVPVVNMRLIIDRDPVLEGENTGYVSVAGDMLRRGTTNRNKDQLDQEIDLIGASLHTSSTSVYGSALKKHVDKLLELFADVTINANFPQAEFDKVIKQFKSGLAAEKDDPTSIANRVLAKLMYGANHPYGERATEQTVDNISLQMCKDYYNIFFTPNIAYLAVVGDITRDEIKPMIEKYFGGWKQKEVETVTYPQPEKPSHRIVAMVDRPNAVQSTIRVGHVIDLPIGSSDEISAKITNTILGGGIFRLFYNLREQHAYTYGAYSSLQSDEIIGNFTARTEVRNEVTDSSLTQILYEMNRIGDEKVPEGELEKAKNYKSGQFALSLENPQTIARFAVDQERYNLPENYYADYLKRIAAIDADQVQQMAQKYIQPEHSYVVVVGKASDVAGKLEPFGEVKFYDMYGNPQDTTALSVPEGESVQTVTERYIKALGGRGKLQTIEDKTTVLTGSMQNFPIEMSIYQKAPNLMYQEVNFAGQVQKTIFNGERAIKSSPRGQQEIAGPELEQLKLNATLNWFLNPKQYDVQGKLEGLEEMDGNKVYRIAWTLPSGFTWYEYFDPETGLKVKEVEPISTSQGELTRTTIYSDYREINGIKVPFQINQSTGPRTLSLTVSSVKFNSGVNEEKFTIEK